MTSVAAGLSDHMKMYFMDHSCPLRSVAMMTGSLPEEGKSEDGSGEKSR